MAKISVKTNCGNSPKKEFLRDFNSAMANGEIDFLGDNISDKIYWEINGKAAATTKENYLKTIQEHQLWKVKELVIETIITHGVDAAVNGYIITTAGKQFLFCDIYKFQSFKGTTIKSIKTFII